MKLELDKRYKASKETQDKLNEISRMLKEKTGENITEGFIVRTAIHKFYKKMKDENGKII